MDVMITEGMIVDEMWAGRNIERRQRFDAVFYEYIELFKKWKSGAGTAKMGTNGVCTQRTSPNFF